MKNKSGIKLYVWEDVLRDYTPGLAVVLAHNEAEAREIMVRDFPGYVCDQLPFAACKKITEPHGFFVYGGG